MDQPKKTGNRGLGRPKGAVNKTTANAREAIARLVDGNTHRLEGWLDEIEEKQGALAAWRCMMDVIEYHIPKLQRSELTGPDGGGITLIVRKFGD